MENMMAASMKTRPKRNEEHSSEKIKFCKTAFWHCKIATKKT